MAESLSFKARTHEIIFEADTKEGKLFDIVLIVSIVLSVVAVMLESISSVRESYGGILHNIEWFFTIIFTIEYALRIYSVGKPVQYATSFFGIIDLLAIIPTYLSIFLSGTQFLVVIRVLRVLRIFRVLKFAKYIREIEELRRALRASRRKIAVFMFSVILIALIAGSLMYVIEGEENGITSIPRGVYWAIVTMTTVGYGDLSPQTDGGQILAAILMIMGYGIIAVPTGIVTSELSSKRRTSDMVLQSCPECSLESYERGAKYCAHCGELLNPTPAHNDG